jgi:ABC-type Fe3+-hydroxamate transport system substrate-binding protein
VIARYPGGATRESLVARDGWQGISAVRSGRVVEMESGAVKRPGVGLVGGLEALAEVCAAG